MDGQFIGQVPPLSHLDGVYLADEVGNRRIRGGQLLAVAVAAMHPAQRRVVTLRGHQFPGVSRDRCVRVVVDLGPGHDRHPLVQQFGEAPDEPCLSLPALAEEDHVVPGQQGVLQLGKHRVVIPDDVGEQRLANPDAGYRVATKFG